MSTHSTGHFQTGTPIQSKGRLRSRVVGTPFARGRRPTNGRFAPARDQSRGAQTVSIEEAIAQFVDKNPAQLYRGGA
jgi:hypothetical protein